MDHLGILKRMWKMLWSYRALWVFGIILALTTSSGGRGSSGAQASGGGGQGLGVGPLGQFLAQFGRSFQADLALIAGWAIAAFVVLCGLGLLLAIVAIVARYVAETAVMRMVDEHETTGEKRTVGQGIRLGWSRAAVRLFLIGLVVTVPIVIAAILLLGLTLLPLLAWVTEITAVGIFGTVLTIGLFFLVLLVVIVVAIAARLLVRLAWRAAALEDLGVGAALRRAWTLIRRHLGAVALMWLIMLGISLGYGLLMIPVFIAILILGGLAGGAIVMVVRLLGGLVATGAAPWVVGGLLALPVLILIIGVPMIFLSALYRVYESGVWTLTFRELVALEALEAETAPEIYPAF